MGIIYFSTDFFRPHNFTLCHFQSFNTIFDTRSHNESNDTHNMNYYWVLLWILQRFGKKETGGLQTFALGITRSEREYLQRVGNGENIVEKDGIPVHRHKPEHPSEAQQRQQHNRYLHTAPACQKKRKNNHINLWVGWSRVSMNGLTDIIGEIRGAWSTGRLDDRVVIRGF